MTKEHVKALLAKYPELLKELRSGEPECGDGWYALIDEALAALQAAGAKWKGFVIIKEKWGELRMQGFDAWRGDRSLLGKFEARSREVCYDCGAPATRTVRRYYRLCVDCAGKP